MHVRALADANIVTTADVCNTLIISVLFVFIHIMLLARSCEDGDKPRPTVDVCNTLIISVLFVFIIPSCWPAAARTGINPAPSMLQTKQLTFIYFSLTLIISILAFVVLSYRDTKP